MIHTRLYNEQVFRVLGMACAVAVLCLLYFYHLTAMGLVSTDEPRYAAVGREMAQSGDWVTPRLWGKPWFEKPALLYWMTALGVKAGLSQDLAPRLPVATVSVVFLGFYFFLLRREFGELPALYSVAILSTCAGWVAYSGVGVTDLPLAASFSAAVLLTLPWLRTGERRLLPWASALLGLAVLAKGLVPVVLALPVLWAGRKHLRDLMRPAVWLPFLVVALPWYALNTWRNGFPFIQVFFLEHQLGRFTSDALKHVYPFWFYVPVLVASLFPWMFLLLPIFRRELYKDRRISFLLGIVVFGFVFFSASKNKLPGYLLPLLPSLVAVMGNGLATVRSAAGVLLCSTLLFASVPVIAWVLPPALGEGLSHAFPVDEAVAGRAALLIPVLLSLGAVVFGLDRKGHRVWAVGTVAGLCVASLLFLKVTVLSEIDQFVSARPLWNQAARLGSPPCQRELSRSFQYGLAYYAGRELPDCGTETPRVEIGRVAGRASVQLIP